MLDGDNRLGIGYWRASPDDIFEMMDPLDFHKKEEAQRFMCALPRSPDSTKLLIHGFDQFLSVDERFYEIIHFNKDRYKVGEEKQYAEALNTLKLIEETYRRERKADSKSAPFKTIKLISTNLTYQEKKLTTLTGENSLICEDLCITLRELSQYLERRKIAFYRS